MEIKEIDTKPVNINLLYGHGTTFNRLFNNYDCYYNLLKKSVETSLNFVDGFNLDIEEYVDINNMDKVSEII